MNRKILGYIGVAVIGIGFIMMAAGNVLNSVTASILQAVMGTVFILTAIVKIISECKQNK